MNRNTEELRNRVGAIANLPTLPHIASRLMRVASSPDTSAAEAAALVAQDVSLSAKVLRLANSAFYGVPKGVTTLNNAVVILGFKVIQTMVLGLTVFDMFSKDRNKMRRALFDRGAFWRHSLKCGVTARLLACRRQESFTLDPEEAFCAGLLHDIGKVVMEQYLNIDFHKALHHARINGTGSFTAERTVLGYTHCDVAAWLIEAWSLPDNIVWPIVYHHTPEEAKDRPVSVMICHIADIISNAESDAAPNGMMGGGMIGGLTAKAQTVDLSERDLLDAIEAVPEEMEKASLFIGHL